MHSHKCGVYGIACYNAECEMTAGTIAGPALMGTEEFCNLI
jgi:hypothetical protein